MNKYGRILIFTLTMGFSNGSHAQSFFAELGGPAGIYSLNYDTRFGKNERMNGLGARIGFELGPGALVVPVQLNFLIGSGGQYLELGAGLTFVTGTSFDFGDGPLTTATVKYRYQPIDRGITWGAGLTLAPNIIAFPVLPSMSIGFAL